MDAINPPDVTGQEEKKTALTLTTPEGVASGCDAHGLDLEGLHRVPTKGFGDGDARRKQEFQGLVLLWVAYQSIGVIYGDIGTSPLYVFSSTFPTPPSNEDLVGALSLIIWAITLIVTVKYVGIVLNADDDGEGGSFAVYSLLTRYLRLGRRYEQDPRLLKLERYKTNNMRSCNVVFRRLIEQSVVLRNLIKLLAVLGVCLVIADGILTPAQSILGAVQGIKVAEPDITTSTVVGISCAIIVVLFMVQPFGTSKLGSIFAPVVILWLTFNFAFGIYNLAQFDHTVLRAFSPHYAINFFQRNKTDGWKSLGGILLAFTGVEALYADLGAFSTRAIRLSWLCFAYPCLLLAYVGQAAYFSRNPEAVSNPFFNSVPPGMFWPSLVLSFLAAIVASQAMITATFQLLSQAIKLSYFPNIKVVHTSNRIHSQIYIPMANWLMMVGTVIVTAVYNNTTSLGNAYGVCVILVTFITTCLVTIAAVVVWKLHFTLVLAFFLIFGTLDCLFLTSALTKVPNGAWLTLAIAAILSSVLLTWRYGKNHQRDAEQNDLIPPATLVGSRPDGTTFLKDGTNERQLRSIKGLGIYFDKAGYLSPPVFTHFLKKFEAQHELGVFLNLRQIARPTVPEEERYSVSRMGIGNTFRVICHYGYRDFIFSDHLGARLMDELRTFLDREIDGRGFVVGVEPPAIVAARKSRAESERAVLDAVQLKPTLYILGKENLRIKRGSGLQGLIRYILLTAFIWMRDNTRSKPAELNVPLDKLVEIGFVKEI